MEMITAWSMRGHGSALTIRNKVHSAVAVTGNAGEAARKAWPTESCCCHPVTSDSWLPPWTAAHQASPSFTFSRSLPKLMSPESVMLSNHLILYCPLLLLPCLFQHQGLFQWGHQVAKVWSFSFSISPANGCSELISFRIDLFDLLAVQGTLKSLLQHHSSEASILWHSAFFMVQLSCPYMATRKTIALTRWNFAHTENCGDG